MKKLILTIFLIALFSVSLFAQNDWFLQANGSNAKLRSVSFVNAVTGWAVGDNIILTTTNGGLNWTAQQFSQGENDYYEFNSICFSNSTTGWISGKLTVDPPGLVSNVILKTTNGGINWIQQYLNNGSGLNSVCFPDPVNGRAAGNGEILATSNGGLNWKSQQFSQNENDYYEFKSVYFSNSMTGWISGKLTVDPPGSVFNVILKTTNGGINWTQQYLNSGLGLNSISFPNTSNGWAAGDGVIISTSNGGANWNVQATFERENCDYIFKSVYFLNSALGWIVGGISCSPYGVNSRIILKTTNGGSTWKEQVSPLSQNYFMLSSVFFTNQITGWTVGDGGIILKTTNGGITGTAPSGSEVPNSYLLLQNYPNPFNPSTNIKFAIPEAGMVKLTVYDIIGNEAAVLVDEYKQAGNYTAEFNASGLSSGVYFYTLQSGEFSLTKKMILIK